MEEVEKKSKCSVFERASFVLQTLHDYKLCFSLVVEDFMGKIAIFVHYFPLSTMVVILSTTIICSFGIQKLEIDSSISLFVPRNSDAFQEARRMAELFPLGPNPHLNQILVTTEEGQGNILEKESMDIVWEIDQMIRNTPVGEILYRDVCQKVWTGIDFECETLGGLKYWEGYEDYLATVASNDDVLKAINVKQYPDGSPVRHDANLGNIDKNEEGEILKVQAILLKYPTYEQFKFYERDFSGIQLISDGTEKWEETFLNFPVFENTQYKGLRIYHNNRRDEISDFETSTDDLTQLIIVSGILMFILGSVFAGGLKNPKRQRKCHCHGLIGVFGVVSSLMSTASGFGICAYFGLKASMLNLTLPFVLVGIGVDDMFLIISHYEATDLESNRRTRIMKALQEVGPSIFFTTASDMVAFGLSGLSSLEAVKSFGIYAAICVFLDFLYQVTFFVAVLLTVDTIESHGLKGLFQMKEARENSQHQVLDNLSQEGAKNLAENGDMQFQSSHHSLNRMVEHVDKWVRTLSLDRTAHIPRDIESLGRSLSLQAHPKSLGYLRFEGMTLERQNRTAKVYPRSVELLGQPNNMATSTPEEGGWLNQMCMRLARLMLSGLGKGIIVCLCLVYWILIAIAASNIEESFDETIFYPNNSNGKLFSGKTQQFGLNPNESSFKVNIVFESQNLMDPAVQRLILQLQDEIIEHEFIDGPLDSVFTVLTDKANELSDLTGIHYSNVFDERVLAFALLDQKFNRFCDDFIEEENEVFPKKLLFRQELSQAPSPNIHQARVQVSMKNLPNISDKRKAVQTLKSLFRKYFPEDDKQPYLVDGINTFIVLDILGALFQNVLGSFLYGLVGVALLVSLFIGSFRTVFVTCLFLLIADVSIYAIPALLQNTANLASYIMTIVSFGIVVDYFVHFMTSLQKLANEISRDQYERAIQVAMAKVGPPMLLLSLTSVIAAVPLLFAVSELGRIFGQIYIMIVFNGLFHGLVAIPVFLSVMVTVLQNVTKPKKSLQKPTRPASTEMA